MSFVIHGQLVIYIPTRFQRRLTLRKDRRRYCYKRLENEKPQVHYKYKMYIYILSIFIMNPVIHPPSK